VFGAATMLGVLLCSRISSRCLHFKSIIRSADNVRNQQGAFAPANKRRHFLYHIPRCLHGCRAAAARMPGRRAPPIHPSHPLIHCCGIFCGAAHARHFQTVYLQQWLANRQLVSFFEPCDNVQKKGFLSIAKTGAPFPRYFSPTCFPPASCLLATRTQKFNQRMCGVGCGGLSSLSSAASRTSCGRGRTASCARAVPGPRVGPTRILASLATAQGSSRRCTCGSCACPKALALPILKTHRFGCVFFPASLRPPRA
jgi:hypothetical protein